MKQICVPLWLLMLAMFACNRNTARNVGDQPADSAAIKYAQGFTFRKTESYTEVCVFNPWTNGKVLQRYILVDKGAAVPDNLPEGVLIRTPLERVVCFSAVQCGVLNELDRIGTIVGVCEPEYFRKFPSIGLGLKTGRVTDLGVAANPNIEKILSSEPEVIFTSPLKEAGYGQLEKMNLPFVDCVDYMEATPLARAEWIRFYALFFNREAFADSLFRTIVDEYEALKSLAASVTDRPTVLTETPYRNTWYLPGGKSYAAHLLKDAGAAYLWENDDATGSLALAFETVLDKAEHADFWLIKCFREHDPTYSDLLKEYELYASFDAFRNRNIFVCNTEKASYYEELLIHPEYVLKDLIRIFHPDLIPGYTPKYYVNMKE